MSYDALSTRMKENYEHRTRYYLPRRTNIIARYDGKAFHSYTKYCQKPFDDSLMSYMDAAGIALCEEIQGAKCCYIQSDELNVLITDYDDITTEAWFDNNIQKICSVGASIATGGFYRARLTDLLNQAYRNKYCWQSQEALQAEKIPNFDGRCFSIPDLVEVANYFNWRNKDWLRNSVSMLCRSYYSHKEMEGKSVSDMHEMLYAKNVNWNNLAPKYKRGRLILRKKYLTENPNAKIKGTDEEGQLVERHKWEVTDIPDDHGFNYWFDLVKQLTISPPKVIPVK